MEMWKVETAINDSEHFFKAETIIYLDKELFEKVSFILT